MRLTGRFVIVLMIAQFMLVLATVAPAMAAGAGFISGSVFVDLDGDTMVSLNEPSRPDAPVFVQSEAEPSLVYTTTTDAQGYFVLNNLPYGRYTVWAAGNTVVKKYIEIGEVNAAVSLDLPVYDNSADVELMTVTRLFLPVIAG